ncbi:MAG: hypothetical protein A3C90_02175 [Candidatus Magasanikbacteria bacterium RIFCSPHIGHO2_02_FULL_51_14]|uniref:DUF1294 domain-containing protein n=1 Tax=Candidatus Magasanikbacteria bacterium RIFCSPHIGHO2_02_FULL_51_14 TaxID=1798683 RepID=A0A1F6MR18_9BACT|nr:MAG: hypothetical protein A3C90_02175 [Candidatus Magasanikbacteria bacterium RIFCSPHIGHO2_02_FULL_51_14]
MIERFLSLPLLSQILLVYFIAVNVVSFFYFGLDKLKAELGSRRVSERRLWALALLGGSLGAFLGMNFFRHKTQKASFQAILLLIFLVQIAVVFLLMQ